MSSTRLLKIAVIALVVATIEWRMADPVEIAADPERRALPIAMLALLVPIALGAWAYEITGSASRAAIKIDVLWGVLFGTLCYAGYSLLA